MITIQWDALLAEQFDMYYIDENGDKAASVHHPPYICGMLRENTGMADREICRNVPNMAVSGAGSCDSDF